MTQTTLVGDERPNDLVLKHFKEQTFDWEKYEDFLDALCKNREYQKEAIKAAVTFLLSEQYKNIRELAEENYNNNEHIRELHHSKEDFIKNLEFPDKLCGTIDLATGTGKSWVMYGVAQILLCENAVDRVLVLVPTLTIEKQLKEKFEDFTSDTKIKKALPTDSKYKNAHVISADRTIMPGDICIENDEAVLEHLKISLAIRELEGKGERTLIVNDEAHHLISKECAGEKLTTRWHDFVKNPKYKFKYILNCTGTPYKENKYFKDVIYRYSIRKAIEEGYIKDIRYLTEDEGKEKLDKFSLIYTIHEKNRKEYPEIKKPLTIFVTAKVDGARELEKDYQKFLIKKGIKPEKVKDLTLVVSSYQEHKHNVEILERVDNPECEVEYIFSVSMLTEGWDVRNVFQIVPHEERAFNSKLLISQVLGRGLRIPLVYMDKKDKQPLVTVTNHDKWSKNIESYVDAVTECNQLASYPVKKKPDYNFDIDYLNREREVKEKIREKTKPITHLILPPQLGFKHQLGVSEAKYQEVKEGKVEREQYEKEQTFHNPGDVAIQIFERLKQYDKDNGTNITSKIEVTQIKALVQKELKRIGEDPNAKVEDENRQRALQVIGGQLFKNITGTDVVDIKYSEPLVKNTSNIGPTYVSTRVLMGCDMFIVFDKNSVKLSKIDDEKKINLFEKNPKRPNGAVIKTDGKIFKCPLNIVHINYNNEREFAERLIEPENAKNYDSWVKIPNKGFYEIHYSYRHTPTTHRTPHEFSPDFFIKKGKDIIVVEIKSPNDLRPQNVAKNSAAERYFEELNKKLNEKKHYTFMFLSPESNDYTAFFESLKKNSFRSFTSGLQRDLRLKNKKE